jgi:signal transduction histidine kinase
VIGSFNERVKRFAFGSRLPRRTIRLRLTLLYGGLFLVSGAALLAITYVLVVNATSGFIFNGHNGVSAVITQPGHDGSQTGRAGVALGYVTGGSGRSARQPQLPATAQHTRRPPAVPNPTQLQAEASRQHASTLHQLLIQSGIALALMSLASILLGWLVAGRVLRPLRTITSTTRQISANDLHRRLALEGPDDELKELGDTIDELFGRLAASFEAQRRFVADASHELRTPLALSRAMLQVALADPELTLDSLRAVCDDVLSAGEEHEQLIEALLMLARSQRGLDYFEPIELAAVVDKVLADRRSQAEVKGLTINSELDATALISGDPRLVSRLVSNLVENAVRYNVPLGHVDVTVRGRAEHVQLNVSNSGPSIPTEHVERLVQPFQRLVTTRGSEGDGHGLGLSIVAAIAGAHDAALYVEPEPGGGLGVEVRFPGGSAQEASVPGANGLEHALAGTAA